MVTRRQLHPVLLWCYVAVFAVLATAYTTLMWLGEPPRLLWTAIGVLGLLGCATGAALQPTAQRAPWWLLTAGVGALMAGDALYDVLTVVLGQDDPFPSVADVPYIAMYPLVALGLARMVRARTPGGDVAAVLDSAIVTVSIGLLVWVFLVTPYIQDTTLSWLVKVVSVAYPLGDVLVLAVLARLLLVPGQVLGSLRLLTVGAIGLLTSDVFYLLGLLKSDWATGGFVDLGWMFFYGAWGAAALHPDMPRLTDAVPAQRQVTTPWRLAVLALVPLIPPGLLLVEAATGPVDDVVVVALSSAVLILLVAARLNGAVATARNSTRREAVLRRVSEAMVAVESRDDVVRIAADAVAELVGSTRRVVVASWRDGQHVHDSNGGPGSSVLYGHALVKDMALLHKQALATQRFALLDRWQQAAVEVTDCRVLIAGIHREGTLAGAILVAGRGVERADTIASVCALATQVVLALDSAEAAQLELQRKSEAHFRSLVQNATDVIVTVDADFAVRFQTPSAHALLGWVPSETSGRPFHELVVPEDTNRAFALLHRTCAAWSSDTGTTADGELRLTDRTGGARVFEVSCSNLLEDPHVQGIVITLHDVTDRRRLETQLKHQAFHDPLTELPNRALFRDRVDHALARRRGRHDEEVAVMLIDLDDFKLVNDTRGHGVGDALLVQVADRLRRTVREEDTCARLGGDEFAVLMEGLVDDAEAVELAERICFELRQAVMVEGETVNAGASIGVATTDHSEDATDLLRQADLAMYAAKDAGGSTTMRYRPSMQDSMHARAQLARDLENAIREREFVLFYQPVVSLEDGRLLGVEALLRWQHPERGLLLPGGFIDAVERSELAVALGAWVIEEAVAQAARWRAAGTVGPDFRVNVNVAPRQLAEPGLVDVVTAALADHRLPPDALVLEITERVLAGNEPETVQVMHRLNQAGVRLVLDDFGTGYSALSYLRRFPVSGLKIDRSFVSGLNTSADDAALVEAIIRLAQTFDLDLVAEGVETGSQSVILSRLGCRKAQGFLYSPPLPAAEITDRLAHDLRDTHHNVPVLAGSGPAVLT
ncbi:MAG: diguanylate cyclase/phosphodiesterase (GGDEF & EAL domains) with PAS/PAC sensor(s) [uncultured Nocardioidaceae bacterium]|uniref:Diguanylate cyclase/phosphodiesterase (GGDEF & EAL domains) with PAS/PAC sensor(S) n=1 Tax=uncultured Nocardioidaceae bacterium TaxID=253824 RepID=A0A6J4KY78_9ACTN|nr:MAG: diguanylate cyclase/phosphodiesterase (GGDEF & EAL domains) with PAS/PAC sensor(s) [uncultured Nocardioidaceae bacterium]